MAEQTFRSPGFFEREVDVSGRRQAPIGVPAGVIGTAVRGPAFVPVTVGSFEDFVEKFGDLDPKRFGPYAVKEFMRHRPAATYVRVLGAGANSTIDHISNTRRTGQVRNAGFVVTGTVSSSPAAGSVGAVQFLVARHQVSANEAFGFPIFTDNGSVSTTQPLLVRGVILTASGSRILVVPGSASLSQAVWNTARDNATVDSSGKFKLVVSSTDGPNFFTSDGLPGIKVFTASLNPSNADYFGKVLNKDPEKFAKEQHLLYCDFMIDDTVASASGDTGAVGIVSGSTGTSSTSGDTSMAFRDVFGHFDARYAPASTPFIISQPFAKTEYDLFKFEALDDGAYANDKVKISITDVKKSTDPKNEHGSFSVMVRKFDDLDTNQVVLEQFPNCNLDPNSDRYVAKIVGDRKIAFNFDAETDAEKRLIVSGKYPNASKFVRIIMNKDVDDGLVPAKALPFGFRGYEVLRTTPTLLDTSPVSTGATRLWGSLNKLPALTASVVPPVPFRFKVTRGSVASSGYAGNPGTNEIVDGNLHWGVKFERGPTVLDSNASQEANASIASFAKFSGMRLLDALVTGSSTDTFHRNKFTLSRVAFTFTSLNNLTGTAADHMKEAAYVRNGDVEPTNYTVGDGVIASRMTLGTLVSLTSSVEFNKFATFNKFSMFLANGFDGVNILDLNAARLNDRASSFDVDGGANSSFTSPGLANNNNGVETANNAVNSYKIAAQVVTDTVASNINLLAIPGIREPYIADYAAGRTKDYGLAMYVMDLPPYDDAETRLFDDSLPKRPDVDKVADKFASRAVDNNYVATYFPDVAIDDDENNRRVTVPASVAAYAALAFNDRVAFPWFAPAGFNRASLDFVKGVATRLTSRDRDTLQEARINPIAPFPRAGFVIFGQKTLQYVASALDRVNVRRMLLEVKRIVVDIASKMVFEQNTPAIRAQFVNDVTLRLGLIQAQAGVESFGVVMDSSNNTQSDVEQNRLNGRIKVVPTRAAEFIDITFVVTNSGVTFT